MDWFVTTAAERSPAPAEHRAGTTARVGGQPRHMRAGADPDRLDLALVRAVERQTETVLRGVQVAAFHGETGIRGETDVHGDTGRHGGTLSYGDPGSPGAGPAPSDGSPAWLAADVDLLVQLVRLAAAAGVVLPHGVAGVSAADPGVPSSHLAASRDCYREVIHVLGRMSVAEEVPVGCRDDALRLLRQVERRVRDLNAGAPGTADHPRRGVFDHEFIPGELLG